MKDKLLKERMRSEAQRPLFVTVCINLFREADGPAPASPRVHARPENRSSATRRAAV